MSPDLQQARSAIANEIGPDAAEFEPSTEKHFAGEVALLEFGGMLLFAFFKGLVEKTGETAGKKLGKPLGSALGDFFGGLLKKLRHQDTPVQDRDIESAYQEAAVALKTNALSPEQIQAIGIAVESALASALAAQADRDVSNRVARRVRKEALKVVVGA